MRSKLGHAALIIGVIIALFFLFVRPDIVVAGLPGCQYPERPVLNGQCDNSDPCDPTRIKIDGGKCVELPLNQDVNATQSQIEGK